jgi:hypothetical protein
MVSLAYLVLPPLAALAGLGTLWAAQGAFTGW